MGGARRWVAKGTLVKVRRVGEAGWRPYTTTRVTPVVAPEVVDGGAFWLVRSGGWQMLVAPSMVRGGPRVKLPKCQKPKVGKGQNRPRGPRPADPLKQARDRAAREARLQPSLGVGSVSAPGDGADEWREQL